MKKHHIFSGRAPSEFEKQGIQIDMLNMELKRMNIEPVKKGRSKAERQANLDAAKERAEVAREEWARRAPLRSALASWNSRDIISAFMDLLDADDQAKLRAYDSDEILELAEIYAENPDFDLDDAIEAYYAQQEEAFAEMEEEAEEDGEDAAGFAGVPFI